MEPKAETGALVVGGKEGKGGEIETGKGGSGKKGDVFDLGYDKLVVAVGCYSQTFGTKGVKENALFLKDVGDARKIRKRILDCESIFQFTSSLPFLRGSAQAAEMLAWEGRRRERCLESHRRVFDFIG